MGASSLAKRFYREKNSRKLHPIFLFNIYDCSCLYRLARRPRVTARDRCPGNVTDGIFYGGVATLVNNSLAHKSITLNTHLQAVAVRVSITVCSLYLSPSLRWTKKILKNCYLIWITSASYFIGRF